ncbi:MAG: PqqD family protein [Bacteroidaceae bacterium]|nr:PqqD family protein [Bacteroidaceae bacterium]
MKLKKGFVLREICGETVILGEGLDVVNFNKIIDLNETAAWIWREAERQKEFSVDGLTEAVCNEYEVEPETARSDVNDILTNWKELGLLE